MDDETKQQVLINVDRIEEILNDKDEKISDLEFKLAAFERRDELARNEDEWIWTEHVLLDEDDMPELPLPRLQLQWQHFDERSYNSKCWYFLVFRHLVGEVVKVPLGMTSQSGGRGDELYPNHPDGPQISTPFRDGAHIVNESRQFGMPAFVIQKDKAQELFPDEKGPGCTRGSIIELSKSV